MAYTLNAITMRESMDENGMARITEVWRDISTGRIPLMVDSDGNPRKDVSPITKYHSWDPTDVVAETDFTIMVVPPSFWDEMAQRKDYARYESSGADVGEAAQAAWNQVAVDAKAGKIKPVYTDDYESTVPPEYTKDGKWNCIIYVHIESQNS